MKKIKILIVIILTALSISAQEYTTIGNKQFRNVDGEWFQIYSSQEFRVVENKITIKFNPDANEQEITNFAVSNDLTLHYHDTILGYYVYLIPENEDIIDVLSNLHGHQLTQIAETQTYGVYTEFDHCDGEGLLSDDPLAFDDNIWSQNHQWYLRKIGADCAWQIETGNKNVVVAVLDTGVDYNHEDIGTGEDNYENIVEGFNAVYSNTFTMDYCPDGNCHGTKMAGLIAAKTDNNTGIAGIAGGWYDEGVKILPVVVGITLNAIEEQHLIAGINHVVYETDAKIINMSFIIAQSSFLDAKIAEAYEQGILLIASSGNNNDGQGQDLVLYPARHPDVIAVGATDIDDTKWFHGHYGLELELSAPGKNIWTTDHSNYFVYSRIAGGTSASTAIVSGVSALLYSYNPCLTNEEVRQILKETADKVGHYDYNWDPENPGHSRPLGYGRVNAYEALLMANELHPDYFVSEDETWSVDRIHGNIIINQGAALTLNSIELGMLRGKKIIIKQGGKLIVNNGIITSPCGDTWQGIEVWGNNAAHQWPDAEGNLAQGYLELNDAVIENAIDAVVLWKPGDNSSTGGILFAENTVFRNNKRSVHALNYKNFHPVYLKDMDNRTGFTRCTFVVNENYHGAETFYKHVDLSKVNGIRFNACTFILTPGTPFTSDYNMAIGSYSAGFSATGICTVFGQDECLSYDYGSFTGFHWAINAVNASQTTNTFNISHTIFNNNTYGIRASDINNLAVLHSDFHISYNEPESDPCDSEGKSASAYGIHMTGCTGFAIEENYFTKASGAPTGNYTGILIAESQSTDQVYRNYFDGLSYGNYAVGKNWFGVETWKGLAYYCNENSGNWRDFHVIKNSENIGGVQNPIGSPALPSGNTFSTNADYHIYNDGSYWFGYYYYAPSPGYTSTPYYPANVYRATREEVVGIQNQCPSNYGGGGGTEMNMVMTPEQKQQAEMDYAANLSDYSNVKTLFDNLKDGGSTEATLTDIATAWPSDMWELRAELLGKSPHLSMDVLKAAADRTDVLPESVILEIMAANPDELKKEELINYLEDKDNPLPEYMIDILMQVAMGSSYKTVLLRQMAHYGQLKTRAANNIVRSLLNDTIADNNELRNWLDNIGGKRADEQIIASYMGEGNFTNALALANMMPALYNYSANELAEHNYYMDMLNLQISLEQQQRTISDLDSLELANLLYIAENSNGTAGIQAKGILEYAYGYHYCNCIEADESGLKSGKPFNPASLEKLSGIEITVVPNPAKDWATFNYTLPGNATSGVVVISDASGREVASMPVSGKQGQQIWDTRPVKSGVYFYTLNAGGFSRHGKIVISK